MLTVLALGTPVPSTTHHGVMFGKSVIFPDGYSIERPVLSPAHTTSAVTRPTFAHKVPSASPREGELYFTASIRWAAGQPTFTVHRSDKPAEQTYTSKSATTVWRQALEDAVADFPGRQAELPVPFDAKAKLQVNGIRLYGLHLKDVQDELMELPDGRAAYEAAAAANARAALATSTARGAAGPASAAATLVEAELDTRSASLLSAPQSQSQTGASRSRATSPKPKKSPKAAAVPSASVPSSRQRITPSRRASVDKDAASSGAVVGPVSVSSDSRSPEHGAASPAAPSKKRQSRKPSVIVEAVAQTDVPTAAAAAAAAAAPPTTAAAARRSRVSGKKTATGDSAASAATSAAPPAAVVVMVCPDCQQGGTPFCAATGKPHLPPPCTACGLTTAFCPINGQPHTGAVQRENRQRGEVHLPGTARKPRRRLPKSAPASTAPTDAVAGEVIVLATQDADNGVPGSQDAASLVMAKPRRKRARVEAGEAPASATTADAPTPDGAAPKPGRSRRPRKAKEEVAVAAPSEEAPLGGGGGGGGDDDSLAKAEPAAVEEPAYTYPPLRPPLTIRERHRAAHLLQEAWKAQYGDGPVLPASVAALPLALVPVKRSAAATAGTIRRKRARSGAAAGDGGGDGATGEGGRQSDHDEDAPADATHAKHDEAAAEEDHHETARSDPSSAVGSPTSHAAAMPTLAHPLEVTQMGTSVAGKRLSKFLLQYTSERALFDLLRSAAAAAGGPIKRVVKQKSAPRTAAADGGGGETAELGDQEHVGEAPAASPTEDVRGASLPPEQRTAAHDA
ncbi:hypothetical protein NESM_000182400 [Novymonas esmeraldas]|uniref:Uncharacterized protein n=1 Tax=Novymonas esmeraldas TaxID=1808958 RepID=A0AAW0F4L3_9TRYP